MVRDEPPRPEPFRAHLVCGGRFHDFDYARLRLLTLLAEHEDVRVSVGSDYRDADAIAEADFLVTYTCDVRPTEAQQDSLREAASRTRWLALHGTNALFDVSRTGAVPVDAPWLVDILGSRFLAHPPVAPYAVQVANPDHPLVRGIEDFTTDDELYLCEVADDIDVLLETSYRGEAPGWAHDDWTGADRHAVAYRYGNVYYLTLGHCRGHHDMRPLANWYPHVERGAWDLPVFDELLRRGIAWAMDAPSQRRTDIHRRTER